jgi:hypothetical protein
MYGMAVLRAYTSRIRQRGVVMTNNHQGELQASTPALDFPTLEALASTPASRGLQPHLSNPALPVCALTSFHDLGDPAIALLHGDRLPSAFLLPLLPACLFHGIGDPRAGSPSNAAHDKAKYAPPDIQPHAAFVEPRWTCLDRPMHLRPPAGSGRVESRVALPSKVISQLHHFINYCISLDPTAPLLTRASLVPRPYRSHSAERLSYSKLMRLKFIRRVFVPAETTPDHLHCNGN